ncbi:MAG: glycosyltransferase family 2 protein [Lachnospiraceae bacterium]|jgi:GT2 family glycosyltransferase
MSNRVAAVVVTYNRKELLLKCIEHLKKQSGASCDILVIDNASNDGTEELFQAQENGILYFNTGSNLGGAGGFSYGIRKAVELGYDYLWILDDDTLPNPTALIALLNNVKLFNGEFGFLSSKVLWKDNSICTMNVQKETKWRKLTKFEHIKGIQYASFVSLFIKADMVRNVGLPYKEFFIWADDWEYTRRISKVKKSYFIPDSVVVHWCNSNVGADIITAPKDRIDRFKYMYRNDQVLYRQDGLDGKVYLLIRNIVHIVRILLKADNKLEKIKIIMKSSRAGRSFYPVIDYPKKE